MPSVIGNNELVNVALCDCSNVMQILHHPCLQILQFQLTYLASAQKALDSTVGSSSTSNSDSDDETMDIISTNSSQTSDDLGADHMLMELDTELDGMLDLVPMSWRLSDDDLDSD